MSYGLAAKAWHSESSGISVCCGMRTAYGIQSKCASCFAIVVACLFESLPPGWEYRLPTEAQREYACRAGTATATAFGDKLDSTQANFDGNYPYNGAQNGPYLQRTTEGGSYRANAWGLYDMHGNVAEWCRDSYSAKLPGGSDPEVTEKTSYRVHRGGAGSLRGGSCRSADRTGHLATSWSHFLGFRVAIGQSGR
jgi:formylglycine-generating enzyme required for sulfatase activity